MHVNFLVLEYISLSFNLALQLTFYINITIQTIYNFLVAFVAFSTILSTEAYLIEQFDKDKVDIGIDEIPFMENNRLILVIVGLIMIVFAFTTSQTQAHHMMMYGRVDYTPYFFAILGLVFVLLPFLESTFREKESSEMNGNGEFKNSDKVDEVIADAQSTKNGAVEAIKVRGNDSDPIGEKIKLTTKLLNEDEASIFRMIYENEGITQDSIHFRTGFSHSKISMIMKKLEEKDLIVRERFGKTYKVYLSEWLTQKVEKEYT